jgi:hypothetical protein
VNADRFIEFAKTILKLATLAIMSQQFISTARLNRPIRHQEEKTRHQVQLTRFGIRLIIDVIPTVLAECKRVLKSGGRLAVASMATVADGDEESVLEHTYIWMHTHFPHIVDCQPIPLENLVADAGFMIVKQERIDLFTMPVAIVVATTS